MRAKRRATEDSAMPAARDCSSSMGLMHVATMLSLQTALELSDRE